MADHCAACGLTLEAALDLSWERLSLLAEAHERRSARQMLQFMVACQGDEKSWKAQSEMLRKLLK